MSPRTLMTAAVPPENSLTEKQDRIAKVIARAGLCSRREAERLIDQGRVALNDEVLTSPAVTVGPEDRIEVDGVPLPVSDVPRLWRFHKVKGVVTTARDPEGRPTIMDRLPPDLPRVMPVGRLDINSEGLLLLTNDGGLKRHLELPATGWIRRYRVRVYGRITAEDLKQLAGGITVEGIRYGPIEARIDSQSGANTWLTMALKEGKNREIRKVCDHLGVAVNRLIRVAYGPFQLGKLPPDSLAEVPSKVLNEQLGAALSLTPPQTKGKAKHAHRRRKA